MTQPAVAGAERPSQRDIQLALVILSYGSEEKVRELLDHLHSEMITVPSEVIIVHNPSDSHPTISVLAPPNVRVVEMTINSGYVGGMNAGIAVAGQSDPEFVLLLTHDVRITALDVETLYGLMCTSPDLGAIGPVLCRPDGSPYSAGFVRRSRLRMQHLLPGDDIPRPVWPCVAVDGSVMMWRTLTLEQVGGFDERFFMYLDDIDICTRAMRCGWRVAVATGVRVISTPGGSQRRSAHAYLRSRNGLAYARSFGTRGFISGLVECVVGLWQATPKPGGRRFLDPNAWRITKAYWRGTVFGVLDYFRGNWGPPPRHLLDDSDIAATASASEG